MMATYVVRMTAGGRNAVMRRVSRRALQREAEAYEARLARAKHGRCPLDGRSCHAGADPRECVRVNYPLCK